MVNQLNNSLVQSELLIKEYFNGSVKLLKPPRYTDDRGFLSVTWNKYKLSSLGIQTNFIQDNFSISENKGTLRGLHSQKTPYSQAKLISCLNGSVRDVVVDARKNSETFGHWISEILSYQNGKQLFIPEGFLHGFITLQPSTKVFYKCSNLYSPVHEQTVLFNDPTLNIDWGKEIETVTISEKDANGQKFLDL